MKKETRKEFDEALQKDENLRKDFEERCKKAAESGACANDAEVMVKAAEELGWTLDLNELERTQASGEELDLEELEAISGGDYVQESCVTNVGCFGAWSNPDREDEYGHTEWCLTGWHCHGITCHTETEDKYASCWSAFSCIWLMN